MTAARHRIPRLGLTGGIGSGKSTALAYLHEFGAAVVSSDDIVHGLYAEPEVVAAVVARFGEAMRDDAGIDRRALAAVVFRDDVELRWLEDLLYPRVQRAIEDWAAAQGTSRPRPALLAVEVPLLFEAGMEKLFDEVMLITAPSATRRQRVAAKLTESDFARRAARQMSEEEKVARSRFVYHNTGSRKELREFVGRAVAQILAGDETAAGNGTGTATP
jgi:dephospho-CoA kinase